VVGGIAWATARHQIANVSANAACMGMLIAHSCAAATAAAIIGNNNNGARTMLRTYAVLTNGVFRAGGARGGAISSALSRSKRWLSWPAVGEATGRHNQKGRKLQIVKRVFLFFIMWRDGDGRGLRQRGEIVLIRIVGKTTNQRRRYGQAWQAFRRAAGVVCSEKYQ